MSNAHLALIAHLSARLAEVRRLLGWNEPISDDPATPFAELLDSMGTVEFLARVADDCGVSVTAVERCLNGRLVSLAAVAEALTAADLRPRPAVARGTLPSCGIAAVSVRLPETIQVATELDEKLGRPPGWLERHAGLRQRSVWGDRDPLTAVAEAARECLHESGLLPEEVGTLLVTSEAPPLLAGLAAAVHHRLDIRPDTPAIEVGNACTGFLTALWLARSLVRQTGPVLIVAVEAPSKHLPIRPGPGGEAAALFGDAAAAAVVTVEGSLELLDMALGVDGDGGRLLGVERRSDGFAVVMDGPALALRAVEALAEGVRDVCDRQQVKVTDLAGVVAHGGNGRLPGLLARRLGLTEDRVWSRTQTSGNLGSASLPAAWSEGSAPDGLIAWTAVGAGLTWAAALTNRANGTPGPGVV